MTFRITIFVVIVLATLALVIIVRYAEWKTKRLEQISTSGLVANLPAGTMEYSLVGKQEDPVLLYLHGSPGGYDNAITREGFQTLTPSRPGYLKTPLSVGASPEEQARAYKQLLDVLNITSVVVTGASGGGPSAIAFAVLFPEQTDRLILVEVVSDAMALPDIPPILESDFTFWLIMGALERTLGIEGMAKRFIPDEANSDRVISNPAKLSQFSKTLWSIWPYSQRREGWENDRKFFLDLDLPAEEILAPTLIVHGSEDTSVPIELSQRLANKIPGARLEIIEGADHMMPFTHEEDLALLISQFSAEYE